MRHRVAEWFIPDVSRQRHKSQKAHEPRGLETSDTNNPATQRHIPDERPQLQELLINKQTNIQNRLSSHIRLHTEIISGHLLPSNTPAIISNWAATEPQDNSISQYGYRIYFRVILPKL